MEHATHTPKAPEARLHDIGEMVVVNEDHGRVKHRYAMVLVFESPEQVAACMEAGMVRLVPANDLNAEATEAMRHGG